MNSKKHGKKFQIILMAALSLSLLVIGLAPSVSQAAPCTLSTNSNVPAGSVDPATACGVGNSANNIGNATVNAATLLYLSSQLGGIWETITTLASNGAADGFTISGVDATSGTFSIGSSLLSQFGSFVLVLKDGAKSLVPQEVGWAYFLLGGSSGTFSMWGNPANPGNPKELSHATLYASGTPNQASAPATLLLLGFGLIVLAVLTRKRGVTI